MVALDNNASVVDSQDGRVLPLVRRMLVANSNEGADFDRLTPREVRRRVLRKLHAYTGRNSAAHEGNNALWRKFVTILDILRAQLSAPEYQTLSH